MIKIISRAINTIKKINCLTALLSNCNYYYYDYYYYGNYKLNDEEISHIHQTITAVHNMAVVMATRKLRKNRWLDSPMHVSSHGQ